MMEIFISVSSVNIGEFKSALATMCKKYYQHIPMQEIWAEAEKAGLTIVDEDGQPWEGILTGREGRASFDLADSRNNKVVSVMHMQWHKMPSGKYEINAYTD